MKNYARKRMGNKIVRYRSPSRRLATSRVELFRQQAQNSRGRKEGFKSA